MLVTKYHFQLSLNWRLFLTKEMDGLCASEAFRPLLEVVKCAAAPVPLEVVYPVAVFPLPAPPPPLDFLCLLWLWAPPPLLWLPTWILILRSPAWTWFLWTEFEEVVIATIEGGPAGEISESIEALGVLLALEPSEVPLSQDCRRFRRDSVDINGSGS